LDQHHTSPDADNNSLLDPNLRLSQEIQRHVEQLAAINRVAATVSQSLELQVTLQTALDAVLDVIKVDAAGISLVDEAAGELVLRAQRGWRYDFVTTPMRIPLGVGMSGYVVRHDEVMVTGDLTGDPRLAVPEFADEGVKAQALVPMHARGRVVGILSVMNHEPYQFSDEEITMVRAIADQVGIALDNARLYERIKEQSSRLSAVLNSSGDGIIATDNHGNINLVNATAEALFELDTQALMGQPLRNAPLPAKLRDGLRRAMSEDADGNTVFEVTLENGHFLAANVSPVYAHRSPESDQKTEGWVMLVQDITHLREAEQARVNFIHAAAHDLRNPLGVTMGALQMLEKDLRPTSEYQAEIIEIGVQGINRMQDLIDNLLRLEHIESGVGLQSREVDIRELVERAMIDMLPCIQPCNQTLLIDVPEDIPTIMGDMHWLHRALVNLLENANKYTPEGGEIILSAYTQDDDLYLEVKDNGPGIPPELQTRLFERFYRAPSNQDDIRGSGLGLAIVKSVAEQHGGRVFVQSRVGQGSIFGMILPRGPR
jgi:PAS domain S-box-containing protein